MSTKTNRKKCLIVVVAFLCSTGSNAKASFASGTPVNLSVALAAVSLAQGDVWTEKAPMPTARLGVSCSAVNGKIYAIGGYAAANSPGMRTVEEYDPATDTWTTKAPMPTGRRWFSTSVVNGKIYALGGYTNYGQPGLSAVEEYDPATDTWTTKAPIPTARLALATSVVNGIIYAIGGSPLWPQLLSTVEAYDPLTDTWITKADMPTARAFFSASSVNGKIYAIGSGSGGPSVPVLATVEEYDPATDTWTTKAPMPAARGALTTSTVDGKIYAVAGAALGGTPLSTVEAYDPLTDTWIRKTDMPGPRVGVGTSVVDGKLYAIGGAGTSSGGHPGTTTVYEYDPNPLVVDFNGDEIVNSKDFSMLAQYWYRDDSPFVNHRMDYEYLAGFAEHWLEDYRLVAHWKLDETEDTIAYDSIGSNDGTLNGDPNWQSTAGKVDGALEFDGTYYISTDFVLNPVSGFSAFAWIKGGAPGQVIISQADRRAGRTVIPGSTWLGTDPSEGRLMTRLMDAYFPPLESETVITDGQWHHIGLVYDYDALHRHLYVDGAEVAEDTSFVGGVSSDGGLYIGAGKALEEGSFFSGLIDDVCIYNQVLNAEEIEEL